jgi:hypothetical protein
MIKNNQVHISNMSEFFDIRFDNYQNTNSKKNTAAQLLLKRKYRPSERRHRASRSGAIDSKWNWQIVTHRADCAIEVRQGMWLCGRECCISA